MARLLVAADLTSLAQRALAERVAAEARGHGHDATVVLDAPLTACKDADAAVCLLDGPSPGGMPVAVAATAHALGLPTLGLHTHALADSLASLFTQAAAVTREADFAAALPAFYAQVRPFAGKLVRDQVPRLVREAGHQVQFREAAPEERARYLKRKVADEAAELLSADPGEEREEVADLLEALETFLRVRGYERDDLRLVKEAKRKRRGGFERFLIVESASAVTSTPPLETAPVAWPAEEPAPSPPEPEPEVALPAWLDAQETVPAATVPAGSLAYEAPAVQRTYEAPPPAFEPPAIPSFRVQTPPPAPHSRAKLWNLGARGEKEEIPAVYDDPDRIDPRVREI